MATNEEAIKVFVRVRKLLNREDGVNWKVEKTEIDGEYRQNVISSNDGDKRYTFDRVFNQDEDNFSVYEHIGFKIVEAALCGFNTTIFAYGQTASGKTHTMMGTESEPGLIRHAVGHIFDYIQDSKNKKFLLRVSYMEIYNEKVTDLLGKDKKDRRKELKLLDDTSGSVTIEGLHEEYVTSPEDVLKVMEQGEKFRHVGETNMNDRSSRSHTIFRIIIEQSQESQSEEDGRAIIVSHLNLVDLAGSERAAQTGATGERFKEGANINNSLMVLGQVISKLSDGDSFVPFRNSKLTRILKNSLGGNTKTAIVCTVTPAEVVQTRSTLDFAARAKKVVQQAVVNEILDDRAQMKRLMLKISQLQEEVDKYKNTDLLQRQELLENENEKLLKQLKQQMLRSTFNGSLVASKPSKASANDRRMTWCPQSQGNNRRLSFGGILRLQKMQPKPTKSLELPQLESFTTPTQELEESPQIKPSNISTRRKKVQFEPIAEASFESIHSDDFSPIVKEIQKIPEEVEKIIEQSAEETLEIKNTVLGLQAKLERDSDHRQELEIEIENSKILRKEMEQKYSELEKKYSDLVHEKNEQDDLVEFVTMEKETIAADLEKFKVENEEMQVKVRNMEMSLKSEPELSDNVELASLRFEIMQEQENQHKLRENNSSLEKEIQDLTNSKKSDKKIIEDQNYELTLLMDKLRKVEQDKEATIERVKAEFAGSDDQEDLQGKIADLKLELAQENDEKKELEEKLQIFEGQVADLKLELAQENDDKEILEGKILDFEGQIADLKLEIAQENDLNKALEEENQSLKLNSNSEVDKIKNDLETLNEKCQNLELERAQKRQELECLTEKYQKLELENDEKSQEIINLKKNLETHQEIQRENQELVEKLNNLENNQDSNEELVKLRSENESQNQQLHDKQKEYEISVENCKKLETEVENLMGKLERAEMVQLMNDELEEDKQDLREKLKQLANDYEILSQKCKTLESSNDQLDSKEQQLQKLLEKAEMLKLSNDELEGDKQDLREKLKQLANDYEILAQKCKTLESSNDKLDSKEQQIAELQKLVEKAETLKLMNDELEEDKQDLREKLKQLANDYEILAQKCKTLESENDQIAELQNLAEKAEMVQIMNDELGEEKKLLSEKLEKLTNAFEIVSAKFESGKAQLESKDKQIAELQELAEKAEMVQLMNDELEEDKQDLREKLKQLANDYEILSRKCKTLESDGDQLDLKDKQIAELQNLAEKAEMVQLMNDELEQEKQDLREKLKQLAIDHEILAQKCKTLESDSVQLGLKDKQIAELQNLADKVEMTQLMYEEVEEDKKLLSEKLEKLTNDFETVSAKLESGNAHIESKDKQIAELKELVEKAEMVQLMYEEVEEDKKELVDKLEHLTKEHEAMLENNQKINNEDLKQLEYDRDCAVEKCLYLENQQVLIKEELEKEKDALIQSLKDLEEKLKESEQTRILLEDKDESLKEIKVLKEKLGSVNIENSSLRVKLTTFEGEKQILVKRLNGELDYERNQVRRCKEEIRRLTTQSKNSAQDLDSTYVPSTPVSRPPLAEKPVNYVCSSCKNVKAGNEKFSSSGNEKVYSMGSGVMQDAILAQAEAQKKKLQADLMNAEKLKQKEVAFYMSNAAKWKKATLELQGNVKNCLKCKDFIIDHSTAKK